MEKQNKAVMITLIIAIIIGMIGVTIVFVTSNQTLKDIVKQKTQSIEFTDILKSPDTWLPGDTIEKSITITNKEEEKIAVRMSYEEIWTSQNGVKLEGMQKGNKVAIINLVNEEEWTYEDGYYYYNHFLKKGEQTNSLIESVTFNPLIETDYTCTIEKEKKNCFKTQDGYNGASYKLMMTIETTHSNNYASNWNTKVKIK